MCKIFIEKIVILLKNITEAVNKYRARPCSWMARCNDVRVSVLLKEIYINSVKSCSRNFNRTFVKFTNIKLNIFYYAPNIRHDTSFTSLKWNINFQVKYLLSSEISTPNINFSTRPTQIILFKVTTFLPTQHSNFPLPCSVFSITIYHLPTYYIIYLFIMFIIYLPKVEYISSTGQAYSNSVNEI